MVESHHLSSPHSMTHRQAQPGCLAARQTPPPRRRTRPPPACVPHDWRSQPPPLPPRPANTHTALCSHSRCPSLPTTSSPWRASISAGGRMRATQRLHHCSTPLTGPLSIEPLLPLLTPQWINHHTPQPCHDQPRSRHCHDKHNEGRHINTAALRHRQRPSPNYTTREVSTAVATRRTRAVPFFSCFPAQQTTSCSQPSAHQKRRGRAAP
jgi:hypothetical protein